MHIKHSNEIRHLYEGNKKIIEILKDEYKYDRVPENVKALPRENKGCFKSKKEPSVYYDGDWNNGKATG